MLSHKTLQSSTASLTGSPGACWEMLCRCSHSVLAVSRAQQRWRKEQQFLEATSLSESGTEKTDT